MSAFPTILGATLPIFLILGIGAWFRRNDWWPESADRPLTRLAINVFYPCLITHHVLGNPALDNPRNLIWSAGCGFGLILIAFVVGLLFARVLGLANGQGFRTFAVCGGIQNYGFLPIPIIAALFSGDDASRLMGTLFLHNLGLEIAIWTIGANLLRGSDHASWRRVINTPIITIVAASLITLLGWSAFIPAPIELAIEFLGQAAIPVSLFLSGATLWSVNQQTRWRGDWRVPMGACSLRFLILPIVFFGAALLLPINVDLQRNLIIQGSMPASAFTVVLARHFGGHPVTAGQIVITTSLVGLIAIPTLLTLGFHWLG